MTLGEDLLLLAMVKRKYLVWWHTTGFLDLALWAADLIELVMARRIEVTAQEIRVVDPQSVGNPGLDALLVELAAADKPTHPVRWFRRRRRAVESHLPNLVQAGVIRLDRSLRRLYLRRAVLLDPGRRVELCAQVDSVARGEAPQDVRHRVLISLVCQSQLHRVLYPGWQGRSARGRLCGTRRLPRAGLRGARSAAAVPDPADSAADPALFASIDAVLHAAAQAQFYPA